MLVFFRRYRMQFDLRNHRFDELTPPPNFQLLEWQPRLLTAQRISMFRKPRRLPKTNERNHKPQKFPP